MFTGKRFGLWIRVVATLVSTSMLLISRDMSLASDATSPLRSTSFHIALPLHTEGRFILDSNGRRLKLAGVNWYGAEEKDHVVGGLDLADLRFIAHWIKVEGFNSVRLPWSNELYESDPLVADSAVSANPSLKGKHAMQVLDAVIDALAAEGLVVVIDNHTSTADWCCFRGDGNELWYRDSYPESAWISDWQGIVRRYLHQPAVVAVDLRNEVRDGATWGGSDPQLDWHAAAERAANAVLSVNSNMLIVVEGVKSATDLRGVASLPVRIKVGHRLVNSPHHYSSDHGGLASYQQLEAQLDGAWGYLSAPGKSYTAPLWLGEFGTCHLNSRCVDDTEFGSQGFWFSNLLHYLQQYDVDWCYWPLNGTQSRGTTRLFAAEETFGVMNASWKGPALPSLLGSIQSLQPASLSR